MAVDIGPRIGIDGEAEFRSQLQNINQQIKTLGSEMKTATAEFAAHGDKQKYVTDAAKTLASSIDAQKEKVKMIEAALKESAEKYGENDEKTLKWRQALADANTALAQSEGQLDNVKSGLDATGKEFEKAGDEGTKFGEKLKNGMAVAGQAIAAVGAAAAAAGAAIAKTAVDTANWADDLNTLSVKTGISTEQLQKYEYAAGAIDVSVETIAGSMGKLKKNMDSASSGTGSAAAAFEELGISVTGSDGALRDSNEVFNEAIAALGKIENETERDAAAMKIFGKSAADLNPLIEGGAEELERLGAEAEAAGLIMSQDALDSAGSLADEIDRMKATISGVGHALTANLAGEAAGVLSDLTGDIQRLSSAFASGGWSALSEELGSVIADIITKIGELLPELLDMGMNFVMTLVDGISAKLPELMGMAADMVQTVVTAILNSLPSLLNTGVACILALVQGISEQLPTLIPAAVSAIMTVVRGLLDNIPMIIDAALQLITGLAQGILNAIPVLIEAIPTVITSLIDAILSSIPMIIDTGIQLLTSLVEALPEIIEAIVAAIPEIISGIVGAFTENIPLIIDAGIRLLTALVDSLPTIIITIVQAIPQIISAILDALMNNLPLLINAGVQVFTALITNLPQIISKIVSAVPDIISAIVSAFGSSLSSIIEVGRNIVSGVWQGIQNAAGWIRDQVAGFFKNIVDSAKSALGIHSPSKVFAGIGKNMALGVGEGFTDEMERVEDEINDAMPIPEANIGDFVAGAVNTLGPVVTGAGSSAMAGVTADLTGLIATIREGVAAMREQGSQEIHLTVELGGATVAREIFHLAEEGRLQLGNRLANA